MIVGILIVSCLMDTRNMCCFSGGFWALSGCAAEQCLCNTTILFYYRLIPNSFGFNIHLCIFMEHLCDIIDNGLLTLQNKWVIGTNFSIPNDFHSKIFDRYPSAFQQLAFKGLFNGCLLWTFWSKKSSIIAYTLLFLAVSYSSGTHLTKFIFLPYSYDT